MNSDTDRKKNPGSSAWFLRAGKETGKVALVIGLALVVGAVFTDPRVQKLLGRSQTLEWVEPKPPADPVSLEGAAIDGSDEARVAIIEFADFECPACATFARETLPILRLRYIQTGRVKLAFRHYPLEKIHPMAMRASTFAECSEQRGQFWSLYDALFHRSQDLSEDLLWHHAKSLGLSDATFLTCLQSDAVTRIRQQLAEARTLGVKATPTFLIGTVIGDGKIRVARQVIGSKSFETFRTILDGLLSGA